MNKITKKHRKEVLSGIDLEAFDRERLFWCDDDGIKLPIEEIEWDPGMRGHVSVGPIFWAIWLDESMELNNQEITESSELIQDEDAVDSMWFAFLPTKDGLGWDSKPVFIDDEAKAFDLMSKWGIA